MLKINEIFYSIQGESSLVGFPTVFVRTSGCHLRCHYCDSTHAYYEGTRYSTNDLISKIGEFKCRRVCLTGGEPLLQNESLELMRLLCDQGYAVSLETSGSIACAGVDSRVKKVIDVKTPDSGAFKSFVNENIQFASGDDEFKFVICSEKDFHWAEEFCENFQLWERHTVLYSPAFEIIEPSRLAEKILRHHSKARLQLQLHKYIWTEHTRGV